MTGNDKDCNPLVSVVMNCYNGEKFLKEALDSVYSQTYQNWEIIFWDNCSTDNSRCIAGSFDPRLKYYKSSENINLGAARKSAVEKCSGVFIAFLDVDDKWFEKKLEIQVNQMIVEKSDISYTGSLYGSDMKSSKYVKPKHTSGLLFPNLLRYFEIIMPSVIIRRQVLLDLSINFDVNIMASEEYDLFMQISAAKKMFTVIPEAMCFYRVSSGSLTNKTIKYRAKDKIISLSKIRRLYPGSVSENSRVFNLATAKIWYYKFQLCLKEQDISCAKKNIGKVKFVDFRYFLIYTSLIISPKLYKIALKFYDRRGL